MPGIDSNTVLMLHADGTNGSTTFIDSSASAHTLTANGGAQISTTQNKFGGASAYFDGNGDTLTIPAASDWELGTGDFCIDFWVRFGSGSFTSGYYPFVVGNRTSDSDRWYVIFNGTNGTGCRMVSGNGFSVTESSQPEYDTWYHYAISRLSGSVHIYRDGVRAATASLSASLSPGGSLTICGRGTDTAEGYLNGYIDELRISKGAARIDDSDDPLYCGGDPADGFTPPAYSYTDKR